MAEELLRKMLLPNQKPKGKVGPAKIARGVHHDLESFILVLFYAAIKRGLERGLWNQNPETKTLITKLYGKLFGGHTIEHIIDARRSFLFSDPLYLWDAVDPATVKLLYGCWHLLKAQVSKNFENVHTAEVADFLQLSSKPPKLITYEQLYGVYDIAIRSL